MKNNRIANKFMPIYRKAQVYDKKASKNKQAGYSNNPDYFGDWFGEGQIDFTKIINPNDSGDVYMVKIWCGSGYILDVYLVKANDIYEAMNRVFEWSYKNEGKNNIIFDYDYLKNMATEDYKDYKENPNYWSYYDENLSEDEFVDYWIEEAFVSDENGLYAYADNFFVNKVPEKYLK